MSNLAFVEKRALEKIQTNTSNGDGSPKLQICLSLVVVEKGPGPGEKGRKSTGENSNKHIQWRRLPEIADFCPLSWSKRVLDLSATGSLISQRAQAGQPPAACRPPALHEISQPEKSLGGHFGPEKKIFSPTLSTGAIPPPLSRYRV